MTTAVNIIFTVVVVSIYIQQGCTNEEPYYNAYVRRNFQSPNTYPAPDQKVVDHLKRLILESSGTHSSPVSPILHSGNNSQNGYEFCSKYQEYNTLLQLKDNKSCLRATDVWPILESLSQHSDEGLTCRVHLINQLSAAFGNIDKSPDYCQCHGYVRLSQFPNDYSIFQNCWNDGSSANIYYQRLYNEYYRGEQNYRRQCTHHHTWHSLSQIQKEYCQRNLVRNLAHTFSHYVPEFQCNQVSSVHRSTLHAESTTPHPTAVTTTIFTTPITQPIAIPTCDKYGTINTIIHGTVISHPTASDCVQGDHRASDALVFEFCHTNGAHNWTKGPSVMDNCATIPLYAPVATFYLHGLYMSNGGQAGIFLGCLTNGFKMAAQECFANSTVLNIEKGGLFTRDPSVYSVVLF